MVLCFKILASKKDATEYFISNSGMIVQNTLYNVTSPTVIQACRAHCAVAGSKSGSYGIYASHGLLHIICVALPGGQRMLEEMIECTSSFVKDAKGSILIWTRRTSTPTGVYPPPPLTLPTLTAMNRGDVPSPPM